MPDYVVAGNAAVDKITFSDGTSTDFLPGGATLFALTGMMLWTDNVLMCGGFGADYMEHMGDYLLRNHIDRRGFHVRDEKNPLNYMIYKDAGEWDTYTEYGNEHYDGLTCNPVEDRLEEWVKDAKGVYCFRGEDSKFFRELKEMKRKFGFNIMWEIKGVTCAPGNLDMIVKNLKDIETFSINRTEAFRLFQVDSDEEAIKKLQEFPVEMIVYRVGAEGIYIILKEKVLFAPSFKKFPVVDVTGCGNSSTAAAFYAWCEGMEIEEIAATANITAGINLRYQGAMELTRENRELAEKERLVMAEQLRTRQF